MKRKSVIALILALVLVLCTACGNVAVKENTNVNNNPNMYIIHVTQLSHEEGTKYTIGDPRTLSNNINLSDESFAKDPEDKYKPETTWSDDYIFSFEGGRLSDGFIRNELNRMKAFVWATKRYGTGFRGTIYFVPVDDPFTYDYVPSIYEAFKPDNENEGKQLYWYIYPNRNDYNLYKNHKNNLCWYYPGDESENTNLQSKETFIAPVFRIASSYGKTVVLTKEEARRRCASYQEAGRPAGRWRLPTKAEVKFIATLSAEGKIPILFGSTVSTTALGYYWTATGGLVVSGSGIVDDNSTGYQNTGAFAVRCVYDEWYWNRLDKKLGYKLDPQQTEFIWGDMPKDNTQADLPKD